MTDNIARAIEVIFDRIGWRIGAERSVADLAAAGLLATAPDPETTALIEAVIAWHRAADGSFDRSHINNLDAAVVAYLAAHPEAQP